MKVDNPRYHEKFKTVACEDCPFTNDDGDIEDKAMENLCAITHPCPTDSETYADACELAERENI